MSDTFDEPPSRNPLVNAVFYVTDVWLRFFDELNRQVRESAIFRYEVAVSHSDLASAGTKALINAQPNEEWKIIEIWLAGGTDFNAGGDRSLEITDGTTIYATVTETQLKATASTGARWGDTGIPFPTTASDKIQATGVSQNLIAQYSGGTTDYTSGTVNIEVLAQRVA